jgi:outer membrane protein OmpA-like peptidoglycan-associated protein
VNNTTFENLGLARADAVKQLLLDSISADKMEIDSKLVNFLEDARTTSFGGTTLNWKVRNENIQEIDNKALIYFPYNSTKKIDNTNINNYLSNVAKALKGNDKTVTLTGHTDNIGNPSFNKDLGMQRALAMKNLLVNLGIDANRISVSSEGQSQPIDTNDTEEGRQKNRRVELEIK